MKKHGEKFDCKLKLHQHQCVHTKKSYACSTYGQKFSETSLLISLVGIHTGENPHPNMHPNKSETVLLKHMYVIQFNLKMSNFVVFQ